jgi:hypothetical protein
VEVGVAETDDNCTNCSKVKRTGGATWWYLSNYHGIRGYFCPRCFDLVEHDPWGQPKNKEAYTTIAVKQQLMKGINHGK